MFRSKNEKFAYVLGKNQGQKEEFRRYKKMSKSGGFRKTKSFEGKKKEKKRIVLFANDRNPKFDDSSLKGGSAAYTTVFQQFSYGMDAGGSSYSLDDAAKELYNAFIAVAPAK